MSDISEKLAQTNEIPDADDTISVDMDIHIEVGSGDLYGLVV